MSVFEYLYRSLRKIKNLILSACHYFGTYLKFCGNAVQFHDFTSNGVPEVFKFRSAIFMIGKNLRMNNGIYGNPIGRSQACIFVVGKNARLEIKNNVGLSSVAIVCHHSITIGNNVKIGGGVCIYDTDFHALDPLKRGNAQSDFQNKINKPVEIKDCAFIGAHSTILKGVTIGENSIIGACSVVTQNVPDNQMWAGNPAKFIREI